MATKASTKTHFLQPSVSVNDSLLMTLFIAAVMHVILLLTVNFSFSPPELVSKQIEITLANFESEKPPIKASFLAQENQIGGGKVDSKKPKPRRQQMASQGRSDYKPPKPRVTQKESKPKVKQQLITQKNAEETIATVEKDKQVSEMEKPVFSAESLSQQIAAIGDSIQYEEQSSEKSKIKFINAVSAHKYVAAQYMKDWGVKIERMGELNYPEVARKKGFSATLAMDVGIRADGSIYSIRVTKSSGNNELDKAAKRIVRLSAPFAALPDALLKELDVLVIPRIWVFSDKSGMTSDS